MEEEILGNDIELVVNDDDVLIDKKENIPTIFFSQKIHDQLTGVWKNSIVVKLLGRSIGYRELCNRLATLWKMIGRYSIMDLENGFYLIKFASEVDLQFILGNGPWSIMGYYLSMQQWSPDFDSSDAKIRRIVAWIRLPGMPLQYYHKSILRMIGLMIGEVIRIDYNTESAARGKFARIAVEIDLTKPLVSQICVDGRVQFVEYENLPKICFQCGRYGHMSVECPELFGNGDGKQAEAQPQTMVAGDSSTAAPSMIGKENQNPNFGPWMIATTKRRPKFQQSRDNMEGNSKGSRDKGRMGSRFNILTEVTEKESNVEKSGGESQEISVNPVVGPSKVLGLQYKPKGKPGQQTKKHVIKEAIETQKVAPMQPHAEGKEGRRLEEKGQSRTAQCSPNLILTHITLDPSRHTALVYKESSSSLLDGGKSTNDMTPAQSSGEDTIPVNLKKPPDSGMRDINLGGHDDMSDSDDQDFEVSGEDMEAGSSENEGFMSEEDLMEEEREALNL